MSDLPYSTIEVSGADAEDFLQGQLTADLRELGRSHSQQSAWCNPKGRVICIMTVRRKDDSLLLTLPTELAEHVVQRLTTFRFRAKVEFDSRPAAADELGLEGDYDEWRLARLHAGIPEVFGAQSERFTPHMLNLDQLGAVSLDKGCYTGQEVIARTHHRGSSKRRLHRFESFAPVSPGDKISEGERNIGEVVNAIGCDILAIVPVDKAGELLSVGTKQKTYLQFINLD